MIIPLLIIVIVLRMKIFFPTKTFKLWDTQVRLGRPSSLLLDD